MSYEQHMVHRKNHRKDCFTQQCGGPKMEQDEDPGTKLRLVLTCPNCGGTSWIKMENEPFFKCLTCGECSDTEEMSAKVVRQDKAALPLLDRIDEWRRRHKNDQHQDNDFAVRMACAVIAEAAGYKCRTDWTDALKALLNSMYRRDYDDPTVSML